MIAAMQEIAKVATVIVAVDADAALVSGIASPTAGLMDSFRVPYSLSEEAQRATALAFIAAATPLTLRFQALGLPSTFLADLQALVTAFAAAGALQGVALTDQTGSTGGLVAKVHGIELKLKQLGVICERKYRNDPENLAAWRSVSHVEHSTGGSSGSGDGAGGRLAHLQLQRCLDAGELRRDGR